MTTTKNKIPNKCPSCDSFLTVESLRCKECQTAVNGVFDLPILSRLAPEDQAFVIDFVKSSGSLKTMAQKLRLSYPTVRNRLDHIIEKIRDLEASYE